MRGPGRKGRKNKRTIAREEALRVAQAAAGTPEGREAARRGAATVGEDETLSVSILRQAARYLIGLAATETKKPPTEQDQAQLRRLLIDAADVAAKLAPWENARRATVKVGGDAEAPPLQLQHLTNAQLDVVIDRLLAGLAGQGSR